MAMRAGVLLLFQLCVWTRTAGACTVSCSTDYKTLLNCSCSGLEPPETLQLQVQCSLEDLLLDDACLVSSEQPFCVMKPDVLEEIADVETVCSAVALRVRDNATVSGHPSLWQLRDTVKPPPPVNVSVKTIKDSYTHVMWDNESPWSCLTFRLRLRTCRGSDAPLILETPRPSVQLDQSVLPPAGCRRVDVQARLCPGFQYKGPWSEWSGAASWTEAADGSEAEGTKHYYWLLALPVLLILLCFPKVLLWQKRLKVMTFVPDPGEFFKPLYSSYQGDFKAWVKPAFAGHASLTDLGAVVTRSSLSSLSSQSPGSGLTLSLVHSVSLESVSTVSLPEPYGDLREADAPPGEPLHLSNLHIVQDLDGEEWSGNDYPLMDLDTIDSGFGECSSPPVTEQLLCRHDATDSGPDLFRSSYVKQWTTAQDEEQSLQQDFQTDESGTGTL